MALNRRLDVRRTNRERTALFTRLLDPHLDPRGTDVLRLMLEPGPVRAAVANSDDVGPSLLQRAPREAVGGVLDHHHRRTRHSSWHRTRCDAFAASR